jgi:ABC-type lipoprotein release transport system permease subunit
MAAVMMVMVLIVMMMVMHGVQNELEIEQKKLKNLSQTH